VSHSDAAAIPALTKAFGSPVRDTSPPSVETVFAEALAQVLHVQRVSPDSHFFDDLGADSLVMAHFCARIRKQTGLPPVSMKDIYRHSTIRSLVSALADAPSTEMPSGTATAGAAAEAERRPIQSSTRDYVVCGVLQLLIFLGYCYLAAAISVRGYEWISTAPGVVGAYVRSVFCNCAILAFLFTLPVMAKWVLIGRWKCEEIPLWSLAYVRFWLVKTLIQRNPLILLFVGSPLYVMYLRALGAKIGRGVTVFSLSVPVCTDLLCIGKGTVICKDVFFTCYRAHAGVIQTGLVTLGDDVYAGEVTVIDIETSMGDRSQLGHSSSLHAGQSVPAGEHWHGSPAQRAEVDYLTVEPQNCGTARRGVYGLLQLVALLAVYLPLAVGGVSMLIIEVPSVSALLDPETASFTSLAFYTYAMGASFVLFFGSLLVRLLVVVGVPRLLNRGLQPDRVYRLYGAHYSLHRAISRLTNPKAFTFLFGDSSYIVNYLRAIGYDLTPVRQTGSNFGQAVKHENPFLSSVGSGTMVADGLSIMNADYSSTSFRVSRTSIGANNFLGNRIAYPSQGRTGDNCLLATKAMIPIDGEVREHVGLLGSPSFEIPRKVERDSGFELNSEDELRLRLGAKNKHNLVTIGICLLVRWAFVVGVALIASSALSLYSTWGTSAIALANALTLLFSLAYFVLVERTVTNLRALRPLGCSIYDLDFWRHERFWKVTSVAYFAVLNGTPFKNVMWRLLGVHLGRRVFDDGCMLTERPFVTIGDDCTLNAGTTIQCHSQEDGAFKSDLATIGARTTLGVGAFVHYGVRVGDDAVLAADSFLMKGEDVPARSQWGGNPARTMADNKAIPTPTATARTAVPRTSLAQPPGPSRG
jgi:non-ribosomal peptide synthetase-like protein